MSLNPIEFKRLRRFLMTRDNVTEKVAGRLISQMTYQQQRAELARLSAPSEPARIHYASPDDPPISRLGKKVGYHFMIPAVQLEALKSLSDRDDVAVSELIRQSIREFLRKQK